MSTRAVLGLARVEATLLLRGVVALSGLAVGAVVVWFALRPAWPLWWNAGWRLGYGQVVLALSVMVAAQLATGRARRDALQELYDSLPVAAGARISAHLLALLGALPAGLVLIAGTMALARNAIGTPDPWVLAAGLLLILAAGAVGVALGTRVPHPLAGVLAAVVLFVLFSQSDRLPGAEPWLSPWTVPDQLDVLPQPVPGYPPAAAHAIELAGIGVLAAVAARPVTARHRLLVALSGSAALVVIVASCVLQLRPIPVSAMNNLVQAVGDPSSVQHCAEDHRIRYCLYPRFGGQLADYRIPVNRVLAELPATPSGALTVAQSSPLSLNDETLTRGQTRQHLDQWAAELKRAPANAPSGSAIYLNVGSWPVGGKLADARFTLALATAEWAVRIPPSTGDITRMQSCVPLDQARESIAIWLAMRASPISADRLRSGLSGPDGAHGSTVVFVHGTPVVGWMFPGEDDGYLAFPGPQNTATGYLMAAGMSRLPADRVTKVLSARWQSFLDPRTTNEQLAAALGLTMPAQRPLPGLPPRSPMENPVCPVSP